MNKLIPQIDTERLIHSFKTALACLIGFSLSAIVSYPAVQWVVISIVVVMCAQIYVGSVLQKGYLRFLGTLIGCLFAMITIVTVGADHYWAIGGTIALSSFMFSYFSTGQESLSYAGTLGAATTVIIMLGQKPTVFYAASRFLEISLGILIATVISQLVLPIHARTHLRRVQANTLEKLRDYYAASMVHRVDLETQRYQEFDETISKSLIKQRQLAKESVREPFAVSFDAKHFIQSLQCEKEILRAIGFMHYTLGHISEAERLFTTSATFRAFNKTILESLSTLIQVIRADRVSDIHLHVASVKALREELLKETHSTSAEAWLYIDTFLFSAELIGTALTKLAGLYRVLIDQ